MTPDTRAVLLACCDSIEHAARLLTVLVAQHDKVSQAIETIAAPYEISSAVNEKDLAWLDEVSPELVEGPTTLIGEPDPGDDQTSHDATAEPAAAGTNPAPYVRTYVQDQDQDQERTYTRGGMAGGPGGKEGPRKIAAKFSLTNDLSLSRQKAFDRDLFAVFWAAYPRKVGKKDAMKAFTVIAPNRGVVDYMVEAIEVQRRSRQWCEGFIPWPATWLRGERWTDDLTEPVPMSRVASAAQAAKEALRS